MDFLGKIVDFLKLPWHVSLTLALMCLGVLIVPDGYLLWFGLGGFVTTYRMWISVGVLLFLIVPISNTFRFFGVGAQVIFEKWWFQRAGRRRLHKLTLQEKAILAYFINDKTRTVHLDFQDGTVNDLVRYGVLYRSSDVMQLPRGFAYSMHDWAWKYLRQHPELVQDELLAQLLQDEPRFGKPRPPIQFRTI